MTSSDVSAISSLTIVLLGPTAVGKSTLALEVADQHETSIISVDSRQSYKYLNIGTAKPSKAELVAIPHYNIDVKDPSERDDVQQFLDRCEIYEEATRLPFYVGGSTLHLQGVMFGFDSMPDADREHIQHLEKRMEAEGLEQLYKDLKKKDPDYAERMDGLNRQRIIRALDVIHQTGRTFSSFHTTDFTQQPPDTVVVGLYRERETLYQRINQRVNRMVDQGLVNEVRELLNEGYTFDMPGMKTVGYREFEPYQKKVLDGSLSEQELNTVAEKIKTQTRRYAKRQLTWFRRWPFIKWFDADDKEAVKSYIWSRKEESMV